MSASSNLTVKEEKFCQKLLELGVQTAAYRAAYDAENMAPDTIKVAACQVSKKPRVAAKIQELEEQAAAEARVTRSFILQGLMTEAESAKEGSACVRALELLCKATDGGIFTDRTLEEGPEQSSAEIKRDLFRMQGEIISRQTRTILSKLNLRSRNWLGS